jgi:hypothetical protein
VGGGLAENHGAAPLGLDVYPRHQDSTVSDGGSLKRGLRKIGEYPPESRTSRLLPEDVSNA